MSKKKTRGDGIPYDRINKIISDSSSMVHFVGIGGVSMYSLARLTMLYGAKVSGSDREDSRRTKELSSLGARVFIGHSRENVNGAGLVVYTHAISPDNPEIVAAHSLDIPIVSRAEYMGALMLGYNNRIGVSGSHGKSTTVAMLECIFSYATTDPTVLSGSDLPIGEPLKIGSDRLMIYEACEYRDSFLRFSPTISVGLNLELDHTDYFDSIEALSNSFAKALGRAKKIAVINGDDENLRKIIKHIRARVITFGSGEHNDYRYSITVFKDVGFEFSISRYGNIIGNFEINIPGVFNVHNATAAIVVALEYGISVQTVFEAIRGFGGIAGRLERIGSRFGRPVYYDYAHHPTEISASINALRQLTDHPLTVVFKPHTFSRTKALWTEFCASLSLADYTVVTDIYPARESPIEGITSQRLAREIGKNAIYCPDEDVIQEIDFHTRGAIVLMGAGDFKKIKQSIKNEETL